MTFRDLVLEKIDLKTENLSKLAKRLNLDQGNLHRFLKPVKGRRPTTSLRTALKIIRGLNISPEELMRVEE